MISGMVDKAARSSFFFSFIGISFRECIVVDRRRVVPPASRHIVSITHIMKFHTSSMVRMISIYPRGIL
jgi:hypothetical protein